MWKSILFISISLLIASCNKTLLSVDSVEQTPCDTTKGVLFIRLQNLSKYDISNINIATDSLYIVFGGIKAYSSTCYTNINSFNSQCFYHISFIKTNFFWKLKQFSNGGNTLDRVCLNENIPEQVGFEKRYKGYYTLTIKLQKRNSYPVFELTKDKE